jgi:hypothetical protein
MREANMKRLASSLLAIGALLAGCTESHVLSAPASEPEAAEPDRAAEDVRVLAALGGVEWDADAPAPALREAEAEPALIRLSRGRPADPRVVRARATMALRHHPTTAVKRYLVELAGGAGDPEVVSAALDTLARAFGRSDGAEVRALAERRIDDSDRGVRMAAREALARVRVARWISE